MVKRMAVMMTIYSVIRMLSVFQSSLVFDVVDSVLSIANTLFFRFTYQARHTGTSGNSYENCHRELR
jgi:hypothetical protein